MSFISIFTTKERWQLFVVFLVILLTSAAETLGIGIIFPFMQVVSNPDKIQESKILLAIYNYFDFTTREGFLAFFGCGLVLVFIGKNIFYGYSVWIQNNYLINIRLDVTNTLFQGYLRKPYEFHLKYNSAYLIRNIQALEGLFNGRIQPLFQIATEIFIFISILGMLIWKNPLISIGAMVLVVLPGYLVQKLFKKKLKAIGDSNFQVAGELTKSFFEGFHGIKEVQVMGVQDFVAARYMYCARTVGNNSKRQQVIIQSPKLIMEPLLISGLMFAIIIMLLAGGKAEEFIPTMTLFGVAAFRILISVNRAIGSIQGLALNHAFAERALKEVKKMRGNIRLVETVPSTASFAMQKQKRLEKGISLVNVTYRYPDSTVNVLNNIEFTIKKGHSVGVVGSSGAGKSTLIDIILGLLEPTEGQTLVDGVNLQTCREWWSRNVGYIPQNIYLSDCSLMENIAFGIPKDMIDIEAVQRAVSVAQLDEVIAGLPDGLDTVIGERGTRLSGGQRQRVAIARALYADPEVLVLDEATSALDSETEREITRSIEQLGRSKTMVTITHRLSTVKNCDIIYYIKDGKIEHSGTFSELLEKSEDFRKAASLQSH